MISRRISVSDRLTAYRLSVNMVRSPSACKRALLQCRTRKKAGGEAGGLHRPSTLPTEGGDFHRKVTCRGRALGPVPRKAPSAGATDAGDTLHWFERLRPSALRQRYRDEARGAAALDPHQNAVLVAVARGVDRLAHVAGAGDGLAADLEDDVAFLEAALGRRTLRIAPGGDAAVFPGAGHRVCRRDGETELRHVGAALEAAAVVI